MYVTIFSTCPDNETAMRIAQSLVENKLAACVKIIANATAIYQWQGKIEKANEWQLIIKSKESLFDEIEHMIKSHHPYEVPEIYALQITQGSQDYLNWIDEELV